MNNRRISVLFVFIIIASFGSMLPSYASWIDENTELQMGKDAAKQIESTNKVITDPKLTKLVLDIGKKVAAVSTRPKLDWQFKVLDVKDVNAYSVPGFVYVNKGLLDYVGKDKDALAGVIAHEVGHTTARHAARTAEKQMKYNLIINLLIKKGNMQKLGGYAANLAMLGYSRKDEFEADNLAVKFMSAAGYDPNGMVRFFQKLQKMEGKDSGNGLAVYFRTHPPTADRIDRVQKQIVDEHLATKPVYGPQRITPVKDTKTKN